MSEFIFDGLSPSIRTILDDSFRRGKPSFDDAELQRFIVEIPFNRDIETNLIVFRKLIETVMTKKEFQKERSKSDGWLASRLHNALRLTRREAARKEFWIGLIFQNLDYLWWRFEVNDNNLLGLRRIDANEYRQTFSQLWWAVETLRNGSSYFNIDRATSISSLGQFCQHLDIMHTKPLASTLNFFLYDGQKPELVVLEILKNLNFVIPCFVRDDIAPSTAPEISALRDWIHEKPDLDRLLSDNIPEGPPDSSIPQVDLDKMLNFVNFVAKQGKRKNS